MSAGAPQRGPSLVGPAGTFTSLGRTGLFTWPVAQNRHFLPHPRETSTSSMLPNSASSARISEVEG